MTDTLLLKRSATPGHVPTTAQLALAEAAVNTYDGKLFFKGNNGSDYIVDVIARGGAAAPVQSVAGRTGAVTLTHGDLTDWATSFASLPAIGGTTPAAGAFTTLSASGAVSGAGFTSLLAPYAPLANPTFAGSPNVTSMTLSEGYMWTDSGQLGTVAPTSLTTNATLTNGTVLSFASTTGVVVGMTVISPYIGVSTMVTAVGPTAVTIDSATTVPSGSVIAFSCVSFNQQLTTREINFSSMFVYDWRYAAGTSWSTASRRVQNAVDNTYQGFLEFNPATGDCVAIGYGPPNGSTYAIYVSQTGFVNLPRGAAVPTLTADTNSTGAASTAFVLGQAGAVTPAMNGTAAIGSSLRYARADHVHPSDLAALNSSGRNLFHNPTDRIQQRGIGPWSASGSYLSDRWFIEAQSGTASVTVGALAAADKAAIGDEEAQFCVAYQNTASASSAEYEILAQRVENLRRFTGKTVTASFFAKAASGTPKVAVSSITNYGSGGSTGAETAVGSVTLSTTWARYTLTFAVPSAGAATWGTANTDYLQIRFWVSAGSAWSAASGIGLQSNTFSFWGRQLEIGSVASPVERHDITYDWLTCLRYYETGKIYTLAYGAATQGMAVVTPFKVPKRIAPTMAVVSPVYTNASGATLGSATAMDAVFLYNVTALGATGVTGSWTATADL